MRSGVLTVGFLVAISAQAQSAAEFFNPLSGSRDGIHLNSVSVYGGYFTGGIPFEVSTVNNFLRPGSTAVSGGSVDIGWSRTRGGSSLWISESLSYMVYPERLLMPNTNLTLNWHRQVGQRWAINMAGTAQLMDLRQGYFTPNALGVAASLPTTFDGLSAAMLKGTFTDSQLASALTGAATSLRPEQAYLYGQHIGLLSATVGASYVPSQRTSYTLSISANRTQSLKIGDSAQNQAGIPRTTMGTVSFGWAYSLSPRTQIGLNGQGSRIFSQVQDQYTSTAGVSLGRTMSQHWFVQGTVGVGYLAYQRQLVARPKSLQYTASGSLGYKVRSQTLLGAFSRSIGDAYGLGAGSTNSATAGWTWQVPGSSWSVSATYNYQQLNGSTTFADASWRAVGGISRALSAHISVSANYTYFNLPPAFSLVKGMEGAQSGVIMSLFWSPSTRR